MQDFLKKSDDNYLRFKESLPENLRLTDEKEYDLRYLWEQSGRPKDFKDALSKKLFKLEEDGLYHAPSVEPNTLRFLKSKSHPTVGLELDWYNSNDPSAIEFRNKYNLDVSGDYMRYIPKPQLNLK